MNDITIEIAVSESTANRIEIAKTRLSEGLISKAEYKMEIVLALAEEVG